MKIALDLMHKKRLIPNKLITKTGEVCALGAVGRLKGLNMSKVDPEDRDQVAKLFDIAPALAAEIAYKNDQNHGYINETPEEKWSRVRKWVDENIIEVNNEKENGHR